MSFNQNTLTKITPSVKTEGVRQSRRLTLRAVNDNRAPISYQLKRFAFYGTPVAVLVFFAVVWYFGG